MGCNGELQVTWINDRGCDFKIRPLNSAISAFVNVLVEHTVSKLSQVVGAKLQSSARVKLSDKVR